MLGIKIQKLFNKFDYEINLNESGITILTGPNGFGKTTILNCIANINNGISGILYYYNLCFRTIEIIDNDIKSIVLEKNTKGDLNIKIKSLSTKNTISEMKFDDIGIKKAISIRINQEIEKLNNKKNIEFLNNTNLISENFSINNIKLEYVMKIFKNIDAEINKNVSKNLQDYLNKLDKFLNNLKISKDIYIINEQRLFKDNVDLLSVINYDGNNSIDYNSSVIEELPNKLINEFNKLSSEFLKKSNDLDSDYLFRVLGSKSDYNNKEVNEDELIDKLKSTNAKFEKLNMYGLSNTNRLKDIESNEFFKENFDLYNTYFDDFNEKYEVCSNFIEKLDIYKKIINDKLLFKNIKISKDYGFAIFDEKDNEIPLKFLSSGEKQEIVLFYDLIFNLNDNKIILIDEPEISLHIVWQKMFVNDLEDILKYNNISFLIATHSPQIIGKNYDKQIDLGDLYN